jgi:hypothetical protein
MVEVIDIVRSVVNMLREDINILSITTLPEPKNYTVTVERVPHLLGQYQNITINGYDCIVNEINANVLTVYCETDITPYITGLLKAPYFMIGYWTEIANELAEKGKSLFSQNQKFPLIVVNDLDLKNRYDLHNDGELTIDFYIICESKATLTYEDRLDVTFKNTLNPIAEALIEAIKKSNYFSFGGKGKLGELSNEVQNLPYMGSKDKSQNQINDVVDALLLKVTGLQINKCLTIAETIEV